MALAGLVALGLRDPSPLWSDTIAMLNLLVMLTVILIAVYGSQRRRVMAVGFLVFSIGFLAYLAILTGNLNSGVHDADTPTGDAFGGLFGVVHPPTFNPMTPGGVSFPGGIQLRRNHLSQGDFIAICNNSLAFLLGIAGAVLAQIIQTMHRHERSPGDK